MDHSVWTELLAIDRYRVKSKYYLHDMDRKIVTLLYQPIISSQALSLYMTLWSELERDHMWSSDNTHHSLMTTLQLSTPAILQERKKLEGIGLLNTYVKKEGELRSFIYELLPPLTPSDFFEDSLLNIFLYNQIGKSQYQKVKQYFTHVKIDTSEFQKITRPFNEVFQAINKEQMNLSMQKHVQEDLGRTKGTQFVDRKDESSITLLQTDFNYQLFEDSLSHHLIKKSAITEQVKETILRLAYVYGIGPLEMSRLVLGAINHDDSIEIEKLKRDGRDWYLLTYGQSLPTIVPIDQSKETRIEEKDQVDVSKLTKEQLFLHKAKTLTPTEWLNDSNNGIEPNQTELKMIEDVVIKKQLPPEVINILIHYVMLKTDKKLTKSYFDKIATHWARKGIKTAEEAMDLARKDNNEQAKIASRATKNSKKKAIRTEQVPQWLKEIQKEEAEKVDDKKPNDFNAEALRKQLEKELEEFREK